MLKLRSNPQNILEVEQFVTELMTKYQINADLHPNILISLTEAVNNAIRHGNEEDESKIVSVDLQKNKDTLSFRICDEGSGFDPKLVPDPTCPENIQKTGGRGVFIMKQLCDKMSYKSNGSVVELVFKLK